MKNLVLQALRFFGISGIGWLLDFFTYTILSFFSQNLFLNNTISSWLGVTFTFVFSTRTVFKNESRIPLVAKYTIYLLYQALLIFAISHLVKLIDFEILKIFTLSEIRKFSFLIAKILVTPVTMILNFFVMKFLVEKV